MTLVDPAPLKLERAVRGPRAQNPPDADQLDVVVGRALDRRPDESRRPGDSRGRQGAEERSGGGGGQCLAGAVGSGVEDRHGVAVLAPGPEMPVPVSRSGSAIDGSRLCALAAYEPRDLRELRVRRSLPAQDDAALSVCQTHLYERRRGGIV